MALFDPFGVKKDLETTDADADAAEPVVEEPAPEAAPAGGKMSQRAWAAVLVADLVVVLVCIGGLAARVFVDLSDAAVAAPAPSAAPAPAAMKPAPPPKAPEPPKPEPKKAEPAKAEPPKAAPAKAAPAAAKPEKEKRLTRPEKFIYVDPDAREVSLVGAFLIATGGSKAMFKDSKGAWQTTIYLKTGVSYRYQYQVIEKNGAKRLTPVQNRDVFD